MSNLSNQQPVSCREQIVATESSASSVSDADGQKLSGQAKQKRKNRKKQKEVVSYSGTALISESKSRSIPGRMRNNSSASVDQGYISASPCTADLGVVSPPTHANRTPQQATSFPKAGGPNKYSNEKYLPPASSPFTKVQNISSAQITSSNQRIPSPLFTSHEKANQYDISSQPMFIRRNESTNGAVRNQLGNFVQMAKSSEDTADSGFARGYGNGSPPAMTNQMAALCEAFISDPFFASSEDGQSFLADTSSNSATRSSLFPYPLGRNDSSAVEGGLAWKQQASAKKSQQHSVSLPLVEGKEVDFAKMWRSPPAHPQMKMMLDGATQPHTETRIVPMRCTTFAKRLDFSVFQNVLPRQNINPYRIKMEGEGYGSDDLRNMILAALSMARCSQMNCVLCGVDLPIYDHFPLIDGTMFLSPMRNESGTKNPFKVKIEGKCEYIHAACLRCLEGFHSIVCRMCDSRWEGSHHQLGTLYTYDIFAANPCCQNRLCCKQCGVALLDIRVGLKHFSEYSAKQTCPRCYSVDYHFVKPMSTYQLVGLVFS